MANRLVYIIQLGVFYMPASLYAYRPFLPIRQKTKKLKLTSMSPEEIDAIAVSPSISSRKDITDKSKYQRDLNSSRFDDMKKFWDDPKTQLVDNIVLVVMDADYPGCIEYSGSQEFKFKNTGSKCAQILDGQHRVAGARRSSKYYDEPIPVTILLQSDFRKDELGLIFTKLNSEAEKIDPFIEMHLCSRYAIEPWRGVSEENSYTAMMEFYDDTTSVLYNNIRILKKESKRYSGKVISQRFLNMWKNGAWGDKMPHSTANNKTMIEQFGHMLTSLFDSKTGIWASEFADQTSSLYSSDGFCDIVIQLYPNFYDIAKKHATATEPTLAEWQKAMKSIVDTSTKKHITDVLKWGNYRSYINSRMHKSIFSIIKSLLEYTSSGSGLTFDFVKTLGKHSSVGDFLDNHIGGFTIRIQEGGTVLAAPTKPQFDIYIERAELAFEKATLNIYEKNASGKLVNIYKNGTYKTNTAHPVDKGMIKTHIKSGGFKSGGLYEVHVEQETPGKMKGVQTIAFSVP